jgi:hypothetical protein
VTLRYDSVGSGFDPGDIPHVAPNKGGRPRNERLAALDERAVDWLAEDNERNSRDAAKHFASEYCEDWHELHAIEKNDRVNDIRKRIDIELKRRELTCR